jgi:hypothetical protein
MCLNTTTCSKHKKGQTRPVIIWKTKDIKVAKKVDKTTLISLVKKESIIRKDKRLDL